MNKEPLPNTDYLLPYIDYLLPNMGHLEFSMRFTLPGSPVKNAITGSKKEVWGSNQRQTS